MAQLPQRELLMGTCMGPIDTRWFVDSLNDRHLSQRGLAKHLGCDPSSVHRLLTGKRPMRLDEAEQLSVLLGKPVTEVLDHAGVPMDPAQTVPVCGHVDGILEVHLDLTREPVERVPGVSGAPPNTFALRAMTAGSIHDLFDGCILYVSLPPPVDGVRGGEILDRFCYVELSTGPRLLRWVRRGYQAGRWNLDALIEGTRVRDAELVTATPVLAIRQL